VVVVVPTVVVVDVGTTEVVDPEPEGSEVELEEDSGAVVEVVDGVEVPTGTVPPPTIMGVVDPGFGRQPAGGRVWEGTGPAVGITDGTEGTTLEGGRCAGTGVPGAWTLPNPARSDHQIELTCTTVPVCGALIIKPPPM
jgi:hypothetical protein